MSNYNNQPQDETLPGDVIVEEAAPRTYIIAGVVAALALTLLCIVGVVLLTNSRIPANREPTPPPTSSAVIDVIGNVEPNAPLALRGSGFTPNEQVVVYVTPSPTSPASEFIPLVTVTAGADGSFTVTGLTVPPGIPTTFYLVAKGASSGFNSPTPVAGAASGTPAPALPTLTPTPMETAVVILPTLTMTPEATWPPPPTPTSAPPTPMPPLPTPTNRPTPTPTGTPDPSAVGIWVGRYFANRDLMAPPVFVRYDKVLNFDWGVGSPGQGIPNDNFSVQWTRNENITSPNNYLFTLTVDDGARVFVDGELIINEWRNGSRRIVTGSRFLSSGVHEFRVDYFDATGSASVSLDWKVSYSGWTGRYYNTGNLDSAVVLIRDDADINFDWGLNSPGPEVNPDFFSVSWTRRVNFPLSSRYVFTAEVDDGMRLFVNGGLVMDNFANAGATVITGTTILNAGNQDLEVQYNEKTGFAKIKFTWAPVIEPPTPTPTSPAPTASPVPLPSSTPAPTAPPTLTPVPPSATPEPLPSDTPEPLPSDTPEPLPSDTPEPLPSDTPLPPTETPTVTPTP